MNWARLIAKGWPEAQFQTDELVDKNVLLKAAGGDEAKAKQAMNDIAAAASKTLNAVIIDNLLITAIANCPTKSEVVARASELRASLDEEDRKRLEAKQFARAVPHDEIMQAAKSEEGWNALRARIGTEFAGDGG